MRSHAKASSAGPTQRQSRMSATALAISALALLILAPAALAGPKSVVSSLGSQFGGSAGGFFNAPTGVAVNRTGGGGVPAGSIYVVDRFNSRLQQFKPNGEFAAAFGKDVGGAGVDVCTVGPLCTAGSFGSGAGQFSFGARGIAIDQSTGAIYVSDSENRRIDVYSATGTFEGAFGWGAVDGTEAFQYCTATCHAPGAAAPESGNVPGGQFGFLIGGLAVDSSGEVYVADRSNRRIDVFTPTFTAGIVTAVQFTRAFGWGATDGTEAFQVCEAPETCHAPAPAGTGLGQFGASSPSDVVLDSSDDLYALDAANKRIEKFDSTSNPIASPTFNASAAIAADFGTGSLHSLGFDPSANHLYLAGSNSANSNRVSVAELSSAGAAIAVHGIELTPDFRIPTSVNGLAVDPTSLGGNLFVSTSTEGPGQRVYILNEAPVTNPVTTFKSTTATLTGKVTSNGYAVTYHFEYSADGTHWTKAPAVDADVPASAGQVNVSQNVSGLEPGQLYKVRLVQVLPVSGMTATSQEVSFITLGPIITGTAIEWTSITPTSAIVKANVNPNGQGTAYHVEYVTKAQFENSGFSGASTAPTEVAGVGNGSEPVAVEVNLTGLEPATLYYFRFLATNNGSTATGPELLFGTFAEEQSFAGACPANESLRSGFGAKLPECRAYEQASPVDKLGANIQRSFEIVEASPTGDGITFADANGLPTTGGSSHPTIYLARRGAGGWTTNGLLALSAPGLKSSMLGLSPDFSATLNTSEFEGGTHLQLGDTANGTWTTVVDTSRHINGESIRLVGFADGDPEHAIFESGAIFAPDAVNFQRNLYDLDHGTITDVGRVPVFPETSCDDSSGPACVHASGGIVYSFGEQVGSNTLASSDASKVFFTPVETGRIFVREDNSSTTQISASQASSPDPNGHKPAALMATTLSGSKAFFLSCEKLTDDSTAVSTGANTCTGGAQGRDLYEYDTETGELNDLTVDSSPGDALRASVTGVLGVSEDGSDVYFAAGGVLAPGASPSPGCQFLCNVYLSHEGTISFVARLGIENWRFATPILQRLTRVSANGTLVFATTIKLGSYENEGKQEIYRYAPGDSAPLCISCDPTLAPPTGVGNASLQSIGEISGNAEPQQALIQRNVSADGNRIFFQTPDPLVPADTNGDVDCPIPGRFADQACQDVYEWEAAGTGSCHSSDANGGCIYLLSGGTSPNPSYFGDASVSGGDAFIFTSDQLVPQDEDELIDAYDVRIGGGLAAQHPAPPAPPCEGEACRGAGTNAPSGQGAGTAVFQGPGNQSAKPDQKKRHRKKRHRGKRQQGKRSHRQAHRNRGGAR